MRNEGCRENTQTSAGGSTSGSKARRERRKRIGDVVGATHWKSDSVIINRSYIRSHMSHTGQFVQRSLNQIRLLSNTESWHYVPSDSNPTDLSTHIETEKTT